jgi:hypothetical protein
MGQDDEQAAVARWVVRNRVFIFYGNGGTFNGETFERWLAALEAASDLRLYVGAAGSAFSFGAQERSRANAYFKRRKLRFAAITESVRLRMLGQTARLIGLNLGLYSWKQSFEPFAELGLDQKVADDLYAKLLALREEVETELQKSGR